jgi:NDP-sugar pyrophosphorylase family protein|tara:strand:+ start:974 stop:2137 length:1164 start_codon:yes stop_codon:yes gene_type:complete
VQAIILTAGEGARLSGWTSNRPKGMLSIGNRPILDYLVRGITDSGIKEINMVVGYGKNSVMSYFGDGSSFGCKISYLFQDEKTGTIDALKIGMDGIRDEFILVPGDNYVSSKAFKSLIKFSSNILLSGQAERWSKWGEIEVVGGKAKITFENPNAYGRIHFTGIMKINKSLALRLIKLSGSHLGEALQTLGSEYPFEVVKADYWHNIVYPWDLISGNSLALRDNLLYRHGKIERNVSIKGDVSIGKGTLIRSGTYLQGPLSIGENCDIGPNSVIGRSVSIGDNTTIGAFTEIEDSIVMKNCEIGSYCSLKGSVVGDDNTLGSHCIAIPNDRNIMYFGQEFSISNRGVMIGDSCRIGSRAILEGGSILLSNTTIGEGELYNAVQGASI